MENIVILDGKNYQVQPRDIHPDNLYSAFHDREISFNACWVIKYCQRKMGWVPFTCNDIQNLIPKQTDKWAYTLQHLSRRGLIVLCDDGYHVTNTFIAMCHQASPAK